MKQILTGVVTLILGFFTLVFAAVFGLIISVGALIAKPFLMKKLRKVQAQQAAQFEQAYSETKDPSWAPKTKHHGQTIEGDYQDVTDSR